MSTFATSPPSEELQGKEYATETVEYSSADRTSSESSSAAPVQYRVYRRRWAGLFAFIMLNAIANMAWPWFGPISETVAIDFNLTINQVDWLGNAPMLIFLPFSFVVPILHSKWGVRRCLYVGTMFLVLSAWIRYAGTANGLSTQQAYALLMLGQALVAIAQPFFQVLGPMYSETWFDLKSRTTATTLVSLSNPVGAAIGQLISPVPSSTRTSILVLAIVSTVVIPLVFLVGEAPPTPPTYSASRKKNSYASFGRALIGRHDPKLDADTSYMSIRERLDFFVICMTFGIYVGQSSAFGVVTGQIFVPYGYSDSIAGGLGSVFLFVGLAAAVIMGPIFDRVLTHRLSLAYRILVPITGALWLTFAWVVKANNTGALFAMMAVIGVTSVPTLPIALELACELTRNPEGSSALLWSLSNVFGIVFIEIEDALEAGDDASPPGNMHRALVVMGAIMMGTSLLQVLLKGKQTRRTLDEKMSRQAERVDEENVSPRTA